MSEPPPEAKPDYATIIRNTFLVGGGSVLNLIIGLVRTKIIAVLLGPAGIALFGVFNQLVEVIRSSFSLGLGTSGIRQIAASHAAGDAERVSRVVRTLRLTTWITGGAGGLFTLVSAGWLAALTFGENAAEKQAPIALLGLAVLFLALKTGQGCVVSGTRQLGHYMRISLGGSVASVLASVPCVYFLGINGVAPAVVVSFGGTLLVSWWYSRQIPIADASLSRSQAWHEAKLLVAFGLPIMATGIVGTVSPYIERIIILRHIGVDQLGQYQAAFSLTGVAVTLVLGVMSADFYPRLVAHAAEPARFDDEMNAQIEVALLISAPILMVLSAFALFWVKLLYSSHFIAAAELLPIMCLGVIGRIMASPLRMALLAKHRGKTGFAVEIVTVGTGLLAIYHFAEYWGLLGCAWAFTSLHLLTAIMLSAFMPILCHQRVHHSNMLLSLLLTAFVLLPLLINEFLPDSIHQWPLTLGVTLAASAYCFLRLRKRSRTNP